MTRGEPESQRVSCQRGQPTRISSAASCNAVARITSVHQSMYRNPSTAGKGNFRRSPHPQDRTGRTTMELNTSLAMWEPGYHGIFHRITTETQTRFLLPQLNSISHPAERPAVFRRDRRLLILEVDSCSIRLQYHQSAFSAISRLLQVDHHILRFHLHGRASGRPDRRSPFAPTTAHHHKRRKPIQRNAMSFTFSSEGLLLIQQAPALSPTAGYLMPAASSAACGAPFFITEHSSTAIPSFLSRAA